MKKEESEWICVDRLREIVGRINLKNIFKVEHLPYWWFAREKKRERKGLLNLRFLPLFQRRRGDSTRKCVITIQRSSKRKSPGLFEIRGITAYWRRNDRQLSLSLFFSLWHLREKKIIRPLSHDFYAVPKIIVSV